MGNVKFNFKNGRASILCSNCDKLIKVDKDFTKDEWAALTGEKEIKSIYCQECQDVVIDLTEVTNKQKSDIEALKSLIPMMDADPDFRREVLEMVAQKFTEKLNYDNEEDNRQIET